MVRREPCLVTGDGAGTAGDAMARTPCDPRPACPEDEQAALASARLFTNYLRACRDERFAMSLLPPGRFLMPGNLAGSPALTFAPLDLPADGTAPRDRCGR